MKRQFQRHASGSVSPIQKLCVLSLALCAGCASLPASTHTYTGEYFYNFENAVLTPIGTRERWCLNGDMSKAELPEGWGTSQVTVQGTLGPKGRYGNLGSCTRVLTVTRLLSVDAMRNRK